MPEHYPSISFSAIALERTVPRGGDLEITDTGLPPSCIPLYGWSFDSERIEKSSSRPCL